MKRRFSTIERFLRKVDFVSSPFGCWIWGGCFGGTETYIRHSYGRFWLNEKNVMAHRFSYEYFTKTIIPFGYQIDHLCRNPKCVNPNHLELVTYRENALRAKNPFSIQKTKTHCIRGHIFAGKNLYIAKNGTRKCKECIKLRNQNFRKTGKYTLPSSKPQKYDIWTK